MEAVMEMRRQTRTQMNWPVSVWLPAANRFFNGRSANVSKSGVYVNVPMATPVREGQILEINFPRTVELAKNKGQFARIKTGLVVRVDRSNVLKDGSIGVGVAFN
jgi:hypothetical protein